CVRQLRDYAMDYW
nr:immunoglobulin heavy chain junction region [Mus musculus]MBK4185279.1 immunoglobulin heavy chain junction region [Mus musculus]